MGQILGSAGLYSFKMEALLRNGTVLIHRFEFF